MKLIETVEGKNHTSYTHEELNSEAYYKYVVVAYSYVKKFDVKKVLTVSETVYASPKSNVLGNPVSVSNGHLNGSLVAKRGEKISVASDMVMDIRVEKQLVGIRYESSNPKVASVDAQGNVTCKKPGKAVIYSIAQNGVAKSLVIMINKEK